MQSYLKLPIIINLIFHLYDFYHKDKKLFFYIAEY
jgi:hypothetical protein